MQAAIGKDGICKFTTWTLLESLQKELSGEFMPMPGNDLDNNCTGSLYENN
jgi:hypothetical protein